MRRLRRYARVARVLGVVSLGLGMAGMFGLLERLGLRRPKPVGQREETLVNVVARKPLQGASA